MTLKNYIGGRWTEAVSGKAVNITNPATGEIICQATESGAEDAELAIEAARRSFYKTREWREMPAVDRSDMLRCVADEVERRCDDFAHIDCINHGKPVQEAKRDVLSAVECLRYYADLAVGPEESMYEVRSGSGEIHSYMLLKPAGVCGLVAPCSYPFLMSVWKLAPSLAAGNSVVLKPSSLSPISTVELFGILRDVGLPGGAANLVLDSTDTVGKVIAGSSKVDLVVATGNREVEQGIGRECMSSAERIENEACGGSTFIIFSDADPEDMARRASAGSFSCQGETCSAAVRILVEEKIHDEFVKLFTEKSKRMTIGNPLGNPDIGAVISRERMDDILNCITKGREEGAECLCGGRRYVEDGCQNGYFVMPTVFDRCTADMTIVREAMPGPVVTIQTFAGEDEAISMVNSMTHGRGSVIATKDISRAMRMAQEIKTCDTRINCISADEMKKYQEMRQVDINLSESMLGWCRREQ